jgi:hypothetical protein
MDSMMHPGPKCGAFSLGFAVRESCQGARRFDEFFPSGGWLKSSTNSRVTITQMTPILFLVSALTVVLGNMISQATQT